MKIFISYSSKDKDIAEQIYLALTKERHKVFFDRKSLPVSGDYNRHIRNTIKKSKILIFLISKNSVEKSYALTELKYYQDKYKNPKNKVLPVKLDSTSIEKIPSYLKAVTILEPEGNIVAEVVYEIEKLGLPGKRTLASALTITAAALALYPLTVYFIENRIYSCPLPHKHNAENNLDDTMINVKKGEFLMGTSGGKKETINSFQINKYKITNRQYNDFIKRTAYKSKGSWQASYPIEKGYHPVTRITYEDAKEYCKSFNKRLPKTIEWEYACKGENDNPYPWGRKFKKHMANINGYCNGTTIVGSFSERESSYNVKISGMFGNVMEWTEGEIIGIEGKLNVARGQSYAKNIATYDCQMPLRVPAMGNFNSSKIGFRCVK